MITIWHNPRCSKSRATLAILEASGLPVVIRRYLEDAPSEAELRDAHIALGRPVIDMVRAGEPLFRDLGLTRDVDADTLVRALAEHPILIERPIVIRAGQAVIGRPPEAVRRLL